MVFAFYSLKPHSVAPFRAPPHVCYFQKVFTAQRAHLCTTKASCNPTFQPNSYSLPLVAANALPLCALSLGTSPRPNTDFFTVPTHCDRTINTRHAARNTTAAACARTMQTHAHLLPSIHTTRTCRVASRKAHGHEGAAPPSISTGATRRAVRPRSAIFQFRVFVPDRWRHRRATLAKFLRILCENTFLPIS